MNNVLLVLSLFIFFAQAGSALSMNTYSATLSNSCIWQDIEKKAKKDGNELMAVKEIAKEVDKDSGDTIQLFEVHLGKRTGVNIDGVFAVEIDDVKLMFIVNECDDGSSSIFKISNQLATYWQSKK